jgi:hypothetical protein
MMRLRGTLGRRREHMQFSSQEYANPQGGIISRPAVCDVMRASQYVPLPAPLAKLTLMIVGMYKYCPIHTCQGFASQQGKASMYPTRAAILLVPFSGRANSGLCPATLDIRLRCGRTTPYSVQAVKTCMSHAARRSAIHNAGRHRNPASRKRRARFTSTIRV